MSDQKTIKDKAKIKFCTNNIKVDTPKIENEVKKEVKNDVKIEDIKALILKELVEKKHLKVTENSGIISEQMQREINREIKYEELTNKYNSDIFSQRIFMIICRIISSSKIAKQVNVSNPLYIVLVKIAKLLLMTEIDLIVLYIFLEKIGWKEIDALVKCYDIFSIFLNICITSKKKSSEFSETIISSIFKENHNLESQYRDFMNSNVIINNINLFDISIKDINEKQVELCKPFNINCKEEIIDYNFCVDQILSMSMPYSENRKNNSLNANINNTNMSIFDIKQETEKIERNKIFTVNNPNQTNFNQEILLRNFINYRNESLNNPFLNLTQKSNIDLNTDNLQARNYIDNISLIHNNDHYQNLFKNISNQNHVFSDLINSDSFLGKKRDEQELIKNYSTNSNLFNEHKQSLFFDYNNSSKII
jgi:hypothetical protein